MSQPPDRTDPPNLFDPFGIWKQSKQSKQSQEKMLESWSQTMIEAVNTDAYADSTGRALDAYLSVSAPLRKIMEQTMTQVLSQLSLPSRNEVLSLAERMTNIEMRLDDLDARLDVILRSVERTASAVAVLNTMTISNANTLPVSTTEHVENAENIGAENGVPAKKSAAASRRVNKASAAATTQVKPTKPATRTTQTARTTRGSTSRSRSKTE